MQNVILRALLIEWSRRLGETYESLDAELTTLVGQSYRTSHRFIGNGQRMIIGPFNFDPSVTPATHPEKFEEVKDAIPHPQLNELREMIATIDCIIDQLDQPLAFWHGRITPSDGDVFSCNINMHTTTEQKDSSDD